MSVRTGAAAESIASAARSRAIAASVAFWSPNSIPSSGGVSSAPGAVAVSVSGSAAVIRDRSQNPAITATSTSGR
nr:hypothetical protein [Nocardia sputi]